MLSGSQTLYPTLALQLYDHNSPSINSLPDSELSNTIDVAIQLQVPSLSMSIKIEKVYLVGNEILTQARVLSNESKGGLMQCLTKTARDTVKVHLPNEVDQGHLKTSHYVLGRSWNWTGPEDNVTHIDSEQAFEEIVRLKV